MTGFSLQDINRLENSMGAWQLSTLADISRCKVFFCFLIIITWHWVCTYYTVYIHSCIILLVLAFYNTLTLTNIIFVQDTLNLVGIKIHIAMQYIYYLLLTNDKIKHSVD